MASLDPEHTACKFLSERAKSSRGQRPSVNEQKTVQIKQQLATTLRTSASKRGLHIYGSFTGSPEENQ